MLEAAAVVKVRPLVMLVLAVLLAVLAVAVEVRLTQALVVRPVPQILEAVAERPEAVTVGVILAVLVL
jgi:hypothetical protein